jgi:hypothetical protein
MAARKPNSELAVLLFVSDQIHSKLVSYSSLKVAEKLLDFSKKRPCSLCIIQLQAPTRGTKDDNTIKIKESIEQLSKVQEQSSNQLVSLICPQSYQI